MDINCDEGIKINIQFAGETSLQILQVKNSINAIYVSLDQPLVPDTPPLPVQLKPKIRRNRPAPQKKDPALGIGNKVFPIYIFERTTREKASVSRGLGL